MEGTFIYMDAHVFKLFHVQPGLCYLSVTKVQYLSHGSAWMWHKTKRRGTIHRFWMLKTCQYSISLLLHTNYASMFWVQCQLCVTFYILILDSYSSTKENHGGKERSFKEGCFWKHHSRLNIARQIGWTELYKTSAIWNYTCG